MPPPDSVLASGPWAGVLAPAAPLPAAAPPSVTAPAKPTMRGFDDVDALRGGIYDSVFDAVSKFEPVGNATHTIKLSNPKWVDPPEVSRKDRKRAILRNESVGRRLQAEWHLLDNATGQPIASRRSIVATVPKLTDGGTFVQDGIEYTLANQFRLLPGLYTRRKSTGETETHAAILPGQGVSHRYTLDPAKSVFKMEVGQSSVPLLPVLRALGATDDQLREAWGDKLLAANQPHDTPEALNKLYDRLLNAGERKAEPDKAKAVTDAIRKMRLDPAVTKRTVGRAHETLGVDAILDSTKRLLSVYRGESDPDDRDAMPYQKLMAPDDLMAERIRAGRSTLRKLLWKVTNKRSLAPLHTGLFDGHIKGLLQSSGLGQSVEEVNPTEMLGQLTRVTRLGEGGISGGVDSVPEECYDNITEVFTKSGWKKWADVTETDLFACQVDGRIEFHPARRLIVKQHAGLMYGVRTRTLDHLVTPGHRLWVRKVRGASGKERCGIAPWMFETAAEGYRRPREFLLRALPYLGQPAETFAVPFVEGQKQKPLVLPLEDLAEFLGWYVSEGSVTKKENFYVIYISQDRQSNPEKCDRIEALLTRLGISHSYQGHNFVFSGKQLCQWLRSLGRYAHEKRLPEECFDWPLSARQRLFEAMLAGDGHTRTNGYQILTSTSPALIEQFVRLACGLGRPVSVAPVRIRSHENANWRDCYQCRLMTSEVQGITGTRQYDTNYYQTEYDGMVYCAEVPGELLLVRRNGSTPMWSGNSRNVHSSHLGYVDSVLTPESSRAGVDLKLARGARRGSDGKMYMPVRDLRTGQIEHKSPLDLADEPLAFPGEMSGGEPVVNVVHGNRIDRVPRAQVRYEVPHMESTFNQLSNLVPGKSAIKGQRALMGARMMTQAMALRGGESRLVRSGDPESGEAFDKLYGHHVGAVRADQPGRVTEVTDDRVTVRGQDGKEKTFELHNNLPYNRKSVAGDSVIFVRREGRISRLAIRDYAGREGDETLSILENGFTSGWNRVTGYLRIPREQKRMLRVTCQSGRSVVVTEDHGLVTLGPDGRLLEITPDQCVPGQTRLPVTSIVADGVVEHQAIVERADWESVGLLAGLYLAEGHIPPIYPGLLILAVKPEGRRQEVLKLCDRFGVKPHRGARDVKFTDHDIAKWLTQQFGSGSGSKCVPSWVYSAPREFRIGLIRGYMAGDGCLWSDVNGCVQLCAVSTSVRLRDNLIELLGTLDVFCTLWDAPRNYIKDEWNDAYGLRVCSADIPKLPSWFFYSDRDEKLKDIGDYDHRTSSFDLIPIDGKPARKEMYRQIKTSGLVVTPLHHKYANRWCIRRSMLSSVAGTYGDWARSDVRWDKVVSVEPVDGAAHEYVYDLEVAGTNVFAVDHGLIVHNSFLHQTATVQPGQEILPGDLLARSNYTDDKGHLALGRNLYAAYLPDGNNFEDAVTISASAAREKMASEHLYQHSAEHSDDVKRGKSGFAALMPSVYNRTQMSVLDDEGVIRPGTVVEKGQPLVLGARLKSRTRTKILRGGAAAYSNGTQEWDHHNQGIVTDVEKTPKGVVVAVKSYNPMVEGDKIAGTFGDKGLVKIVPDEHMPHDSQGKPFEVLLNPLGVQTRGNPIQVYEAVLSKIAKATGKPYTLNDFADIKDLQEYTTKEAQKHDIPDTETVTDPRTGTKIPGVLTGYRYLMKLHHSAEDKDQGRGLGGYGSDGEPSRGSGAGGGAKRFSVWDTWSMLSHGALAGIRDAKQVRGQKNEDYWAMFQAGHRPPDPDVPHSYKKFVADLQASGINPVRKGTRTRLLGMTDKDVDALTEGRTLRSAESVNWNEGLDPVSGGLFDTALTGSHGGCFHKSVQVWTEDGMIPIGRIVEERLAVRVYSYNFATGKFELKPVTGWFKNHSPDGLVCASFRTDGHLASRQSRFTPTTLWGTRGHQVYSTDGSKGDLVDAKTLVSAVERLTYSQEQILYGGLLGDLHVNKKGTMSLTHAKRQEEYLEFKTRVFGNLAGPTEVYFDRSGGSKRWKVRTKSRAHTAFYTARSLCYVDRRKTLSREWLDRVDELGLAVWIMDDGHCARSKSKNTISVSVAVNAFSRVEVELLQAWLRTRWNIDSFTSRDNAKYGDRDCGWSLVISGENAESLSDLIAPYVPESMRYKLPCRPRFGACRSCEALINPVRRICNQCQLAAVGTSKINTGTKRLFGGTTRVREMVAAGECPADAFPAYDRWLAREPRVGSAVDRVRNDREITLHLKTVPCGFRTGENVRYERTQTVFDIEVEGNHNYFANGILVSNSKWSAIPLHEPVLNPVFEDPARRLLGLTKDQLRQVMSGQRELNGQTGPAGLQAALKAINVPQELDKAKAEFRSGKKTKRDEAVKKWALLDAADKHGVHPGDWVLSKVPVLPPAFRPVSLMQGNGRPMTADANLLYKELFDANHNLKQLSGHTDQLGAERLALYDAFKGVVGLGDPTDPKNKERGVSGVLKGVFGSSPKFGMVNRKLLGTTVDTVGRSVIVPNADLDMDQAGIPEDKAWDVFKPFVIRRLARQGLSPVRAAEMVTNKDPVARRALQNEMEARPVRITRAPILHRYGAMAFRPVLVPGHSIHLPPVVYKGFGADNDGDQVNYHVPVSDDAVREDLEKLLPSKNLFNVRNFAVHQLPQNEFLAGLYEATHREHDDNALPFDSVESVVRALRRGQLRHDQKVTVPS